MAEQENVRVVQEAYAAFKRGDIPSVLDACTDDVDWFLPGLPDIILVAGQRRGREQVGQFFAAINEHQEVQQFDPQEFIAQGDKVVVLGHYQWRIKTTGRPFESDWVHVFTLRDGKIAKFREYYDTAAGVEAYRAT